MKFVLALLTTLIPLAHVSASAIVKRDLETRAPAACADPRTAVPLLRAWKGSSGDHFYTTSAPEMQNAIANLGYNAEGTTGYVFSKQQPWTVPLYRLWSPSATDHFYTTSETERDNAMARLGYQSEGVTGYVYPNDNCGGLPLYRSYNGRVKDHFYTMSAAEWDRAVGSGWAKEGVTGYMLPF